MFPAFLVKRVKRKEGQNAHSREADSFAAVFTHTIIAYYPGTMSDPIQQG